MAKKYIGIWQTLNIIERLQKRERKKYGIISVFYALNSVKAYKKNLPAADVQEVKHGHWIAEMRGLYHGINLLIDGFPITIKVRDIKEAIRNMPSIGMSKRRGKWKYKQGNNGCYCSECGGFHTTKYAFCHWCGAKMDGKEGNDEDCSDYA